MSVQNSKQRRMRAGTLPALHLNPWLESPHWQRRFLPIDSPKQLSHPP